MGVEAQGQGHVAEDVLGSEVHAFPRVCYQLDVGYGWVVCDKEIQTDMLAVFCHFELHCPAVFYTEQSKGYIWRPEFYTYSCIPVQWYMTTGFLAFLMSNFLEIILISTVTPHIYKETKRMTSHTAL